MHNDGWAYYGGNRYYSPVMGRMLSLQGPLSSAGGYGSGALSAARTLGANRPSGPGFNIVGFNPGIAACEAVGFAAGLVIGTEVGADIGGPLGAAIGSAIGAIAGFFESIFGGGGGGPPPWIVWKLTHRGGLLQLWAQKDGINPDWAPTFEPSAGVKRIGDFPPARPNAKEIVKSLPPGPALPALTPHPAGQPGMYRAAPSPTPPACPGGDLGMISDFDLVEASTVGGVAAGVYIGGLWGGVAGGLIGLGIGNVDLMGRANCP